MNRKQIREMMRNGLIGCYVECRECGMMKCAIWEKGLLMEDAQARCCNSPDYSCFGTYDILKVE